MTELHLARGTEQDLLFIISTERQDGYDAVVGRWDETTHLAALRDGRHAYFVGYTGPEPIGFAIVRDWASADQVTLVKRLAVCNPGQRLGRQLLAAVVAAVFQQNQRLPAVAGGVPGEPTGAPCL